MEKRINSCGNAQEENRNSLLEASSILLNDWSGNDARALQTNYNSYINTHMDPCAIHLWQNGNALADAQIAAGNLKKYCEDLPV